MALAWPGPALKRAGVTVVLLLAVAVPQLQGQDESPRGEIFGGYSFSHIQDSANNADANLNGWGASLTGNFTQHFGVTADFSGTYGSERYLPVCTQPVPPGCPAQSQHLSAYHLMGGPQFNFTTHGVMPFAHALFGVTSLRPETSSQTTFAMGFGGGVDVPVGKHFAYRLFQVDYIPAKLPFNLSGWDHNVRVETGLVFWFGK